MNPHPIRAGAAVMVLSLAVTAGACGVRGPSTSAHATGEPAPRASVTASPSSPTPDPDPASAPGPTTVAYRPPRLTDPGDIPDGFALDRDLIVDTGDGGRQQGPGRSVDGIRLTDLCGSQAWPGPVRDRLATWVTGPEYRLTRELVTFPSAAEAVAAVQRVRGDLSDCPTASYARDPRPANDLFFTPLHAETGYDSVTFGETFRTGLGGGVYQFTRVGRAVLATLDEGEWDEGSVAYGARADARASRTLTAQMCVFTEAGC